MAEYGQGVGQATGIAGEHGAGSGGGDIGAAAAGFVNDMANEISALPPEGLLLLVVLLFAGLIFLKRAF